MITKFSMFFSVLTLLAACQGADSTSLSSRTGVTWGADAATCQPLADQIAAAQAAIATCNVNSDCVLTTSVPSTGYSCLELGVNKNSDQAPLTAALGAFVAAGCNAHQACLMMMSSTDQPCQNHVCVDSQQYSN